MDERDTKVTQSTYSQRYLSPHRPNQQLFYTQRTPAARTTLDDRRGPPFPIVHEAEDDNRATHARVCENHGFFFQVRYGEKSCQRCRRHSWR